MPFSVALTPPLTVDWKPVSLVFSCKNIFRTMDHVGFTALAEASALLVAVGGLF